MLTGPGIENDPRKKKPFTTVESPSFNFVDQAMDPIDPAPVTQSETNPYDTTINPNSLGAAGDAIEHGEAPGNTYAGEDPPENLGEPDAPLPPPGEDPRDAYADASRFNSKYVTGSGDSLEEENALRQQLVEQMLGQSQVNARAGMGRAGFGASGALSALEGDQTRQAQLELANQMIGSREREQNQSFEQGLASIKGQSDLDWQNAKAEYIRSLMGGDAGGAPGPDLGDDIPPRSTDPPVDPATGEILPGEPGDEYGSYPYGEADRQAAHPPAGGVYQGTDSKGNEYYKTADGQIVMTPPQEGSE